ncbi:MAG: SURF1 family protein [Betaproteobacteria bacterium]|nr:SURF1 family protein [Betaproteobacteria bacterium]
MNTPALAKAAMMPNRAKAISSFMSSLSHPVQSSAAARIKRVAMRVLLPLAAIGLAALTASLGFWQLDRARQKDAIEASVQSRGQQAPLAAAELTGEAEQVHRLAEIEGRWLPHSTVFLENRPMAGRAGFIVLTALALPDGRTVLVQRGWQARDLRDRTLTQPVPTPDAPPVRPRARAVAARLHAGLPSTRPPLPGCAAVATPGAAGWATPCGGRHPPGGGPSLRPSSPLERSHAGVHPSGWHPERPGPGGRGFPGRTGQVSRFSEI